MGTFADRYGPWAVVAGGSSGIGGAFAAELARRGCHLLLLAIDGDELEATAAELRTTHGAEVRTVVLDLARDDMLEVLRPHLADLDIGLVVYNAALAPTGRFDEADPDALDTAVALNVRSPVRLVRELSPRLVARGRGGIVLMSSLASLQGTGTLATSAKGQRYPAAGPPARPTRSGRSPRAAARPRWWSASARARRSASTGRPRPARPPRRSSDAGGR